MVSSVWGRCVKHSLKLLDAPSAVRACQHEQNEGLMVLIKTNSTTMCLEVLVGLLMGLVFANEAELPKLSNAYNINWFLLLTKFSPPVNLLTYIISSLFKLTIILAPLMLSHLLVHLPPLPSRSQTALFSMPRLISGINFHFHFANQFHLFTLITSIHPSVLHSPHPSPLHSFTLNSKLTFLVNLFPHRSPTIKPRTDFLG